MNEFEKLTVNGIELQIVKSYKELADELDKKLRKVKNGICSKSIDSDSNKLLRYVREKLFDRYMEVNSEDDANLLSPDDFTNQALTALLPKSHDKFIKRYVGGIYALD